MNEPQSDKVYRGFSRRRKITVTREKILKMEPGRELNMMVAKEVMGHDVVADEVMGDTERFVDGEGNSIWGELTPYSEDTGVAEAVINRAIKLGFTDAGTWWDFGSGSYQPAEAVCKKALLEKMA
jgi:hypothetical protein